METLLYFAYGSNMDQKRMNDRECKFKNVQKATLKDFEIVFNKKSLKIPNVTFANIIPNSKSVVEGMLYTVEKDKIKFLDKFEGYPRHYDRKEILVESEGKEIMAWVYIAQKEWIGNGHPTREYLNFILEGKDFLSESYYNMLKNTITMKEDPLKESYILNFEEFLNEKAIYHKNYTKSDLVKHLKAFKGLTVDVSSIDKKILNFYNYSVNFLCNKYPGYDIEKSTEEGPADEEYMNVLGKIEDKLK